MVLDGRAPDRPPHFELEFQLGKEMFELDLEAAQQDVLLDHMFMAYIQKKQIR